MIVLHCMTKDYILGANNRMRLLCSFQGDNDRSEILWSQTLITNVDLYVSMSLFSISEGVGGFLVSPWTDELSLRHRSPQANSLADRSVGLYVGY